MLLKDLQHVLACQKYFRYVCFIEHQPCIPQCPRTEIIFYETRVPEKFCNNHCGCDDVL
jgi:hypothetical protein